MLWYNVSMTSYQNQFKQHVDSLLAICVNYIFSKQFQEVYCCQSSVHYSKMKFSAVLVVMASLALQSSPRNTSEVGAQQSGNTDGVSNNATLVVRYPPQVMTAPNQLCPSELEQDGPGIHNKIIPQLLGGHSETNLAASCSELLGRA